MIIITTTAPPPPPRVLSLTAPSTPRAAARRSRIVVQSRGRPGVPQRGRASGAAASALAVSDALLVSSPILTWRSTPARDPTVVDGRLLCARSACRCTHLAQECSTLLQGVSEDGRRRDAKMLPALSPRNFVEDARLPPGRPLLHWVPCKVRGLARRSGSALVGGRWSTRAPSLHSSQGTTPPRHWVKLFPTSRRKRSATKR